MLLLIMVFDEIIGCCMKHSAIMIFPNMLRCSCLPVRQRVKDRDGVIQEELDFALEIRRHGDPPGTEIFRVRVLDEQAVVDCDLDIFDSRSLADIGHERVEVRFAKGIARIGVEPEPHLCKKIVVVQIMEELVSQHLNPIVIDARQQLNELAPPRI